MFRAEIPKKNKSQILLSVQVLRNLTHSRQLKKPQHAFKIEPIFRNISVYVLVDK